MAGYEFWPAPMDGVFSESFIRAAGELALIPRWMTSFFRMSENVPKLKIFKNFLAPYLESGVPVCAQIMGRDPALLAAGTEQLLEAGAVSINFNCGCPAPRVVKGGCGGGILQEPEVIFRCVSAMKKAAGTNALSVKFRSGFSSFDELENLLAAIRGGGADKLFFHYRTVREIYAAVPERQERFRRFMTLAADHPVILNGDFKGREETLQELELFRPAGAMLGRNFLNDPGIFQRLAGAPETSRDEFFRALVRHGVAGEAIKGMKRWIFGSWKYDVK